MKNTTAALADCDACIAASPKYWKALRTRGRVHISLEEFEAAVRDFKSAFELAPAGTPDEAALQREVKDAEIQLKKSKMKVSRIFLLPKDGIGADWLRIESL